MFDDSFNLEEYGKKYKKISSKNYVMHHNGYEYGKNFIFSKVEIWYDGSLVATTEGVDGKKKHFKYLYLSFVANIGQYSQETIRNFLITKSPEKTAIYTEEEYNKLPRKNKVSTRAKNGKIEIDGKIFYAANNLNISEYIYCIFERVPIAERGKVRFFFYGVSEDSGYDIIDKKEALEDVDINTLDAFGFDLSVKKELGIRTKSGKIREDKQTHKIDYRKVNNDKISIGEFGEKLAYFYEMKRLIGSGKKKLAKKVKIVSENSKLGYDILSYDENGEEIHIEVKTTKKNCQDGFYLSANELSVANNSPEKYYIYRIYGINIEKASAKMYIYEAPFEDEKYELCPVSFFVKNRSI